MDDPPPTARERRALGFFALIAAVAVSYVAQPLALGLLLGALTAFALEPFYLWVRQRMPLQPEFAAVTSVTVVTVGIAGVLVGLGYLFIARGAVLAATLLASFGPGGAARAASNRLAPLLAPLRLTPAVLAERARGAVAALAERAATLATAVAGLTASLLLGLFFVVLTAHYVLQHWGRLVGHLEAVLPLSPRHTRDLMDEFRRVGRSVLLGAVITGVAQGVLAGLGYAVLGVPEPAFFAAATAVASLIPAVGTLLVWVPLGVFLLLSHQVGHGIALLVYGTLVVVGVSDYVIRPRMIGAEEGTPALVTFVGLLGGVEAFGLAGLIVGPLVMSLGLALLRTYERERVARPSLV